MVFKLLKGLEEKIDIIELDTSIIKFEHQYKDCPWIFVIPKIENQGNYTDLSKEDQEKLMRDVSLASEVMKDLFNPDRVNIAMIGNVTPQLHVHIICRYVNDPYWPGTIWGNEKNPMTLEESSILVKRIREKFLKTK